MVVSKLDRRRLRMTPLQLGLIVTPAGTPGYTTDRQEEEGLAQLFVLSMIMWAYTDSESMITNSVTVDYIYFIYR